MCDKARYQSSEEESMAAAVDAANDDTFVLQDHLLQQQLQLQQQQQQQQRHHSQNSDFHSPAYDTNRNNYPGGGDVLDMGDPPFSLYNIYFWSIFIFHIRPPSLPPLSSLLGGDDYLDMGDSLFPSLIYDPLHFNLFIQVGVIIWTWVILL